jgi:hypothetical protein
MLLLMSLIHNLNKKSVYQLGKFILCDIESTNKKGKSTCYSLPMLGPDMFFVFAPFDYLSVVGCESAV